MKNLISIILFLTFSFTVKAITVNISFFGGVPDGTTDNYYPFKLAAQYAEANPNTTINFSTGTYYIAKYRTVKNDTTDHIMWNNCIGLRLVGVVGTKISMNGSFLRLLDYVTAGCARKSYTTGLSPFWFTNCRNLIIKNMEVTGNVQNTTRNPGINPENPSVTEGSSIMLRFTKCDTVLVDSMYLHHAESDGMTISGDRISNIWYNSTQFIVRNTRSWNNGRQGMSIGGLTGGYFYKCNFSYTGFTGGTYGFNDPAAGVDIEPGEFHFTDNIKFDSCYYIGNRGAQLNVSYPATTSNVTILKCSFSGQADEKPQGITILARYSLVDSCFISLGNRDFKINNSAKLGATIGIRHSTIETTQTCINTSSSSFLDSCVISDCQINFVSNTMSQSFLQLRMSNLKFLANTIFASPAAIASKPTGAHCDIENAIASVGNVFSAGLRRDYTGTITVNDFP